MVHMLGTDLRSCFDTADTNWRFDRSGCHGLYEPRGCRSSHRHATEPLPMVVQRLANFAGDWFEGAVVLPAITSPQSCVERSLILMACKKRRKRIPVDVNLALSIMEVSPSFGSY